MSSLTWTCLPAESSDEHLPVRGETRFISQRQSYSVYFAKCRNSNKKNASNTTDTAMASDVGNKERKGENHYVNYVPNVTGRKIQLETTIEITVTVYLSFSSPSPFIYPSI